MVDQRKDQGSDASRTDPETADQAREDLKKQAEKAMRRERSNGADSHPEQDPAQGSPEVIERDLSR